MLQLGHSMETQTHLQSFQFQYEEMLVVGVDDVEGDEVIAGVKCVGHNLIRRFTRFDFTAAAA